MPKHVKLSKHVGLPVSEWLQTDQSTCVREMPPWSASPPDLSPPGYPHYQPSLGECFGQTWRSVKAFQGKDEAHLELRLSRARLNSPSLARPTLLFLNSPIPRLNIKVIPSNESKHTYSTGPGREGPPVQILQVTLAVPAPGDVIPLLLNTSYS